MHPTTPLTLPDFISTQPLLLLETALPALLQRFTQLRERAEAMNAPAAEQLSIADFVNQRRPYENRAGVAIIHVNDALARGTTKVDRMLGMTDYAEISADLETALADPAVTAILLDINSPGGSAIGAPETAQTVADTRAQKPVVSYIGDCGASAAYYVAAASNAIVAQPSAIVGSVGTRMQFLEFSQLAARLGITPHLFTPKAADLKAVGNPLRAPTPAESDWLQQRVETINADFTAWVQQHRPRVTASEMRGQIFTGKESVSNGLADYTGDLRFALAQARALAAL